MALNWISETPAKWDDDKQRIVGGAPDGVFEIGGTPGSLVPGEWWRVEDGGKTVGYGWMDVTWGWAPVLVAVDPEAQRQGVGHFIMDQLESEAKKRGLHYIFNVIPATHPDPDGVAAWLESAGFESAQSDHKMLRRKVG
jgi:GNAT superfamily N-acetyltransferase